MAVLMTVGSQIRPLRASGETVLLDGGLASELEAAGLDLNHPLWSGRIVAESPEQIVAVHRAYLEAGARILTTASYQLSLQGAAALGFDRERAIEWLLRSSRLALEARAAASSSGVLVAASVGPYGAFLADGSEYRGDYDVDDATLVEFHAQRMHLLAASGVDLLACETIPSEQEARALLGLIEQTETEAWLSFTLRDDEHLSDGSSLHGLVERLRDSCPPGFERLVALGFNCIPPHLADVAVSTLGSQTDLPIVLYPNSGEGWDPVRKRWLSPVASERDVGPESWPIESWWRAGVRLFGGCCRIGRGGIAVLAERLKELA